MKEPNVLEAIDLCVNGNPVDYRREIARLGFARSFQELRSVWDELSHMKIFNPYKHAMFGKLPRHRKKGGNVPPPRNPLPPPQSRTVTDHPIYLRTLKDLEKDEYGLYIHTPGYKKIRNGIDKMAESKRYPKTPKPPWRTITGGAFTWKWYKDASILDLLKLLFKNSWFTKFKKWLKYWFTPIEPTPMISNKYREYQKRHAQRMQKDEENDQIKRSQKLSYEVRKAIKETELLRKVLHRLHRRKKRYSISTPITKTNK